MSTLACAALGLACGVASRGRRELPVEPRAACRPAPPETTTYARWFVDDMPGETPPPPGLAERRCVARRAQLADDISCAHDFNEQSLRRALEARGLRPLGSYDRLLELRRPYRLDGDPPGHAIGTVMVQTSTEARTGHNCRVLRSVFLGAVASTRCAGLDVHATIDPTGVLARDEDGALVVALLKPQLDRREYTECRCFIGCGYGERQRHYAYWAELEPGALPGDPVEAGELPCDLFPEPLEFTLPVVELELPAIELVTVAVDNEESGCWPYDGRG